MTSRSCRRRLASRDSTDTGSWQFPYVVQVDDSLLYAPELMVRHEIRHLPVKRGDELVGVLTDRDVKRALDPELGLPPKQELFVNDVFEPQAYIVDGSEPLDHVLEHVARHHFGSALVARHGRLVGIFTATDACRVLCQHLRSIFPESHGGDAA